MISTKSQINPKLQIRNPKPTRNWRFSFWCLFVIWNLCFGICFAQSDKVDSLKKVLLTAKEDTNKVNTLNTLSMLLIYSNPDSALALSNRAMSLSQKLNFDRGIGASENIVGSVYYMQGDFSSALSYYEQALTVWKKIYPDNFSSEMTTTLGNIGNIYKDQGNYPKALNYFFSALSIAEKCGNKKLIANNLGSIANVYSQQNDYEKALETYIKSLKIAEEVNNRAGIAKCLGNIGNVYYKKREFTKALEYYKKSLQLAEELQEKKLISNNTGSMGAVYNELAKNSANHKAKDSLFNISLIYYLKALEISEELGDKYVIGIWFGNIGSVYLSKGEFVKAKDYFIKELELSEELMDLEGIKEANQFLSELYSQTNNHKLAFEHYKKYITAKDSIANEENTKKQTRLEMQYEFDKKEAEAKAEADKQAAVAAAEKKKQRIILLSVVSCLLLVLVFAGFIFRALRITRKQKTLIEEQKKIVEEKQKEILDSIHYAKRIQTALLPTERYIDKTLKRLMKK